MPPSSPSERQLQPAYDRNGNPNWTSTMSAPDQSVGVITVVPDRVIPIIFVPGVMGSNLMGVGRAKGQRWRLDSASSMAGWITKNAAERKAFLTPASMVLDDQGALPTGTQQHNDELRRRGWGEVGAMSYGAFLVWLENAMNDQNNPKGGERDLIVSMGLGAMKGEKALTKEEVALSYRYRFPVHACGYNWLDDNVSAAKHLKQRIKDVITRYQRERKKCEKVIIVTHSMGGLVARHCSEVLEMSEKILGVVHGVMPAIGAAAVYRRFKSGTEGDLVAATVLGRNAAEMTAVLSGAPGPLQLLPTAEYGNSWLKIRDGKNLFSFPKNGDPYGEIYAVRGKWWSMCDTGLVNPLNDNIDTRKREAQTEDDWAKFVITILKRVKPFHIDIRDKYHPKTHAFFGSHRDHLAYGTVTWNGRDAVYNDLLLRNGRPADALNARHLDPTELAFERSVSAALGGSGWKKNQNQHYTISEPDEDGDGTVPHRSGAIPGQSARVHALLQVNVGHEPAYKDSLAARRFTLRAIVQIAQEIKNTSLGYQQ